MATDQPMRLVLWDIDQTLLDGGGVSRDAYNRAFTRVTGRAMELMAPMGGKTELLIAADTLRLHGITPDKDTVRSLIDAVASELEALADLLAVRGRALPGAAGALQALGNIAGVRQSVLTGNTRALAELKLKVFGLDAHVDLDAGAYGDDAEERVGLLPAAWKRAHLRYGTSFSASATVIVGDTLLDVAAAKANNAAVLAVATGSVSADELRSAGADVVLADLEDTQAVVNAVLSLSAQTMPRP